MGFQVILLILALAAGIVGAIDRIFPDEEDVRKRRKKRRIGFATITFLAVTLFAQGFNYYRTDENARALHEQLENVFSDVPEASGGVAINEFAYLVDDNKPALFRAHFNTNKYSSDTDQIGLYDKAPSDKNDVDKHLLTREDVDDLEGAAYFDSKVYLITSHSNTKQGEPKPRRQRFLEVDLRKDYKNDEIGLVTRWVDLRLAIERRLFTDQGSAAPFMDRVELDAKEPTKTVMEIEGLAIDDTGNVYLGFRGPQKLNSSKALVLRANLNQIFTQGEDWKPKKGELAKESFPKFDVFDVPLGGNTDAPYGIVDMLYYDNSILILTNSAFKNKTLIPGLWQWPIKEIGEKPPSLISKAFFSPPSNIPAKPEVLLLPTNKGASNKVFMFLDAEGFGGGQRSYDKSQLGLAP